MLFFFSREKRCIYNPSTQNLADDDGKNIQPSALMLMKKYPVIIGKAA